MLVLMTYSVPYSATYTHYNVPHESDACALTVCVLLLLRPQSGADSACQSHDVGATVSFECACRKQILSA